MHVGSEKRKSLNDTPIDVLFGFERAQNDCSVQPAIQVAKKQCVIQSEKDQSVVQSANDKSLVSSAMAGNGKEFKRRREASKIANLKVRKIRTTEFEQPAILLSRFRRSSSKPQ